MKGLKFALAYLIIISAVGCGSSRKSVKVDSKKSDTLIVKTETIKAPVINDVMTIKEICKDSVLKEFERVFIRETDTVTIQTVDGSLSVRINQQSRILSERESTIQSQREKIERLEETVKTKYSLKLVLILIGVIVLLWLVPGIPSKINRFVRRLFGSPV